MQNDEESWRGEQEWWELVVEDTFATWDDIARKVGPEYLMYLWGVPR